MEFWKISHGPNWFSQTDYDYFFDNRLIVVGGADQVKNIRSMSSGDYFYLTYGNTNGQGVQLLGRIIDGSSSPCTYAFPRYKYWEQRKYELVKLTVPYDKFYREDYKKKWTPNFISTIARVPEDEQTDFEKYILKPFFGVSIADLPYLPSNPLPSETAEVKFVV